jgi:hypothetical protein
MATEAQIAANKENAQHSTGARTEEGRETSKMNATRHGLTGHTFSFLHWENPDVYAQLLAALRAEHQPQTVTEHILIQQMAQQHWLSQRAMDLFTMETTAHTFDADVQKGANLYLRYQAQHERLFQRALHDLLKLRAERRKAEIGFVSQKQAEAQETRRENNENRKQELHKIKVATAEIRLDRELMKNSAIQTPQRLEKQSENPHKTDRIAA